MMTKTVAVNILGLKPGFSDDELKQSYRKMARKYHPDINHSAEAPEMFMRVKEAYECLLKSGNSIRLILVTHNSIFSVGRK